MCSILLSAYPGLKAVTLSFAASSPPLAWAKLYSALLISFQTKNLKSKMKKKDFKPKSLQFWEFTIMCVQHWKLPLASESRIMLIVERNKKGTQRKQIKIDSMKTLKIMKKSSNGWFFSFRQFCSPMVRLCCWFNSNKENIGNFLCAVSCVEKMANGIAANFNLDMNRKVSKKPVQRNNLSDQHIGYADRIQFPDFKVQVTVQIYPYFSGSIVYLV